jgi:two-component system, NtrC family, sensor kinase
MEIIKRVKAMTRGFLEIPEEGSGPERYSVLRRNFVGLMLITTMVPLVLMALINFYQYRSVLRGEIVSPSRVLVNKTKHSFELFLQNRLATVRFVASAYSFDELADEKNLNRIFRVLRQEFRGFVDIGLIDANGMQVSYAGPYELKGKDYSQQEWFQHLKISDVFISDVFMGYRKFPHIVLAVRHVTESGQAWIVRATIDTRRFDELIASMGLDPQSDAFLINDKGVFQTNSRFYGQVLQNCPVCSFPVSHEPNVVETTDSLGRDIMVVYAYLSQADFVLVLVKPSGEVLRAWYTLKSEFLFLFLASGVVIVAVVLRLTRFLIRRMQDSDMKRELAYREVEHSHKLSSIGRLAAGVAHEVNNPMAIINEKAGLMRDLIEYTPNFPEKEKFLGLVKAIINSVERCRTITHRLLGFARRMDVEIQVLDVNEIIQETVGFLEKEALHRNIKLRLHLAQDLSRIASDRGQLQQVFLNILNNAFAAVQDGGLVAVASFERDIDTVGITIQDDGHGMSEETIKHIFEPFFTTKKGSGTGLGLSITYGIVKKLGGDIEVQSKVGQGTRFVIYLPKKPRLQSGE